MATKYASVLGAGAKTGADWANAYDNTQIVGTALPAIGAGGILYIEAETYNITAAWALPGNGCSVIAVNATSHVEDGSRAILNAGSAYNACIDGSVRSMSQVRNIDGTAATFIAIYLETSSTAYNCIGRNSQYGIYAGSIVNCLAYSNTYGFFPNVGTVSYCETRNNTYGVSTAASVVGSVAFGNTTGITTARLISGCVIDDNTTGVENSSVVTTLLGSSITNNGTAINCNAGAFTVESKNLYKSNTTKFGGTTANIISLGGSVDGAIDPYTDQPTEDYTPSVDAEMINTAFPAGTIDEAVNISYLNAGLNPQMPTSTAPVFAGITKFEILSNNKFYVAWTAGTGTITSYDIYIRNATNPFNVSYLAMRVKGTVTETIVHLQGDAITLLQGGTTYYCGVRADNNGTNDGNTVELSNICSGAELIQRMTVTQPVISL